MNKVLNTIIESSVYEGTENTYNRLIDLGHEIPSRYNINFLGSIYICNRCGFHFIKGYNTILVYDNPSVYKLLTCDEMIIKSII